MITKGSSQQKKKKTNYLVEESTRLQDEEYDAKEKTDHASSKRVYARNPHTETPKVGEKSNLPK